MFDINAWPHFVSTYGYLAVLLLSLVEGPIVTIYAALLAYEGLLSIPLVYAMVVLGDIAGDLLAYGIGRYWIGHRFWQRRFGSEAFKRRVAVLRRKIRSRAGHILLFGKLTQAFGFAVLLAAGAARVRLSSFLFYNLLGTLPKSAFLIVVGYFCGHFYKAIDGQLQSLGVIGFGLGIALTLYMLYRLTLLQHQREIG